MRTKGLRQIVVAVGFMALVPGVAMARPEAPGPESRRMARAKDLIADEQWARAIEELRAAVADAKEPNKDEALFWLAHSQNQENDVAAAVESIRRLEREHASSRWVKPARSLLIELAQKLRRDDVLWWHAVPPSPPLVKRPATTPRPAAARRFPVPKPGTTPAPPPAVAPAGVLPPPAPAVPSTPPVAWMTETWSPDTDERILALGRLIHTNESRVIDALRHIALEEKNPVAARRAVLVLALSRKPAAQSAIVEVAKRGPEPVRVAAVRELGRFGGPEVSQALEQVYYSAKATVKRQVVHSLGERAESSALLRIAQSEGDQSLRASAIVTLGRAGGREQLLLLYAKADRESKRPIIIGLFTAHGEEELIRIADTEQDEELRAQALSRLRLLGTPRARAYLAKTGR